MPEFRTNPPEHFEMGLCPPSPTDPPNRESERRSMITAELDDIYPELILRDLTLVLQLARWLQSNRCA